MIESIEFSNYKALRNTTLALAPFTLLLGPNGSGKSSVLQAIQGIGAVCAQSGHNTGQPTVLSSNWRAERSVTRHSNDAVEIRLRVQIGNDKYLIWFRWQETNDGQIQLSRMVTNVDKSAVGDSSVRPLLSWLNRMSVFMLDVSAIAQPVPISGGQNLQPNGKGLAAVLDDLRDNHPERWTALLSEMSEWLPEYDFIHFDTRDGQKAVALRTRKGGHRIAAAQLSQGTLIALALLTLAYLPNPPSLIGLEEIDRGLHPRLLGHLQSALYRLSYPESCGEKQRPPIQVIATTHSPYLLDLYREHPEEVVLAEKEGLEVQFRQLSKIEHFDEILGDGPLSEIWYSGVLGGVSVKP